MLLLTKPNPLTKTDCCVYLTATEFCIVDPDDFDWVQRFTWKLVKSSHCKYAVRRQMVNGKISEIKMHREIMKAPEGMDVHHVNSNTLDNRKSNLACVDKSTHRILHHKSR